MIRCFNESIKGKERGLYFCFCPFLFLRKVIFFHPSVHLIRPSFYEKHMKASPAKGSRTHIPIFCLDKSPFLHKSRSHERLSSVWVLMLPCREHARLGLSLGFGSLQHLLSVDYGPLVYPFSCCLLLYMRMHGWNVLLLQKQAIRSEVLMLLNLSQRLREDWDSSVEYVPTRSFSLNLASFSLVYFSF